MILQRGILVFCLNIEVIKMNLFAGRDFIKTQLSELSQKKFWTFLKNKDMKFELLIKK